MKQIFILLFFIISIIFFIRTPIDFVKLGSISFKEYEQKIKKHLYEIEYLLISYNDSYKRQKNFKYREIETNECDLEILQQKILFSGKIDSIVIGHAYGRSLKFIDKNLEKFLEKFIFKIKILDDLFLDKNIFKLPLIIFTGDVLKSPTLAKWKRLNNFLEKVSKNYIIAPGNHDIGYYDYNNKIYIYPERKQIFEDFFKRQYPTILNKNNSIYIIENDIEVGAELSDKTINYLKKYHSKEKINLFIFSHNILRPNSKGIVNSTAGKINAGYDNMRTINILKNYNHKFNQIYVVNGDTGASPEQDNTNCYKEKNIFFISSGLGESKDDEIIAIINDNPKRIILDSLLSNIYQIF